MSRQASTPTNWVVLHSAVAALPALVAAPTDALVAAYQAACLRARKGLIHIIGSAGVTIAGPVLVNGYTRDKSLANVQEKWWDLGAINDGANLAVTATRGVVVDVDWPSAFIALQLESGAIAGGTVSVYFQPIVESD